MRQTRTVLSFGYWFSAYSLGLMLHPYKTVRELVGEKRFRLLILAPLVFWVMLWGVGLVLFQVGGEVLELLGLGWLGEVLLRMLAFLWWWVSIFLLLWQVVLVYLGWRFGSLAQ